MEHIALFALHHHIGPQQKCTHKTEMKKFLQTRANFGSDKQESIIRNTILAKHSTVDGGNVQVSLERGDTQCGVSVAFTFNFPCLLAAVCSA